MALHKSLILLLICAALCLGGRAVLADCTDPPGLNGALAYNTAANTMQFCDGLNWVRFPGLASNCALGSWSYGASPEAWVAWESVTYGNGIFVAVGGSGTSRVMTSPDGVTWTSRTAAQNNYWHSVTFGNGTFVAVAMDGTNRVMTSSDGINWTARTAAQNNQWRGVAYGAGVFVAVADTGTNRVMTSPDGITWTVRNAAAASSWSTVTYAEGTFVALSRGGCTTCAMTSQDGINWTGRTAPASGWMTVTYGGGQFVAVAYNGTDQIATSPDGITWTGRTAPEANYWNSVVYADGNYVAVASSGTNRYMYSPDGINWTAAAVVTSSWTAVTYAAGKLVAVATDNAPNQIMTMNVNCGAGTCSNPAGDEGALVFNTTSRVLEWCNGSQWIAAGPLYPGGPLAGCSGPSGAAGDIVYNTDQCLIQYCDGDEWRGVARGPGYVANAVTNAAATATELQINTTISGATDGPRYTLSTWFRMLPLASNQTIQVLFENNSGRIQLGFYSNSPTDDLYDVWLSGKNGSDVWHVDMYKNDYIAENVWYHLVASFDTTLGAGHVYINDQELAYDVLDISSGGQVLDVQTDQYYMHFYGWANGFRGDVADFWFDNVYLDLDVEANRRKFRSAAGRPVNLGATGSNPTGSQPLIFFSGDRTTWATNKGRGGAFSMNGTLQNVVLGDGGGEGGCPQ